MSHSSRRRSQAEIILEFPLSLGVVLARHKMDGQTVLDSKHRVVVQVVGLAVKDLRRDWLKAVGLCLFWVSACCLARERGVTQISWPLVRREGDNNLRSGGCGQAYTRGGPSASAACRPDRPPGPVGRRQVLAEREPLQEWNSGRPKMTRLTGYGVGRRQ